MSWHIDSTRILAGSEFARVLEDLHRRARRSVNSEMNLIIFRLSACLGLRVSEISALRSGDVVLGVEKPYVSVKRQRSTDGVKRPKRGRVRRVKFWDRATAQDVEAWKQRRLQQGATATDLLVCSQNKGSVGRPLCRQNLRQRFKTACKVLGPERVADLTIHSGRHSAASRWLHTGRSLVEVQQQLGHSNLTTTSAYLHVPSDADDGLKDVFPNGDAA